MLLRLDPGCCSFQIPKSASDKTCTFLEDASEGTLPHLISSPIYPVHNQGPFLHCSHLLTQFPNLPVIPNEIRSLGKVILGGPVPPSRLVFRSLGIIQQPKNVQPIFSVRQTFTLLQKKTLPGPEGTGGGSSCAQRHIS